MGGVEKECVAWRVFSLFVLRWRKEGLSTFFSKREVRMERAQYLMMKDTKMASVDIDESMQWSIGMMKYGAGFRYVKRYEKRVFV